MSMTADEMCASPEIRLKYDLTPHSSAVRIVNTVEAEGCIVN